MAKYPNRRIVASGKLAFTQSWNVHLLKAKAVPIKKGARPCELVLHNTKTDKVRHWCDMPTIVSGRQLMNHAVRFAHDFALPHSAPLPRAISNERYVAEDEAMARWAARDPILEVEQVENLRFSLECVARLIQAAEYEQYCWTAYRMYAPNTGYEPFTIRCTHGIQNPSRLVGASYYSGRIAFDIAWAQLRANQHPWRADGHVFPALLREMGLLVEPEMATYQTSEEPAVELTPPESSHVLSLPAPRNRSILLDMPTEPRELLLPVTAANALSFNQLPKLLHVFSDESQRPGYAICDNYVGVLWFGSFSVNLFCDAAMHTAVLHEEHPVCMFNSPPAWHQVREVLLQNGWNPE